MAADMRLDEKARALNAINKDFSVRIDLNGRWYASADGVEVKDGGILASLCGRGDSVQEAIEVLWHIATNLAPHQCLVVGAYSGNRRELRWDGITWAAV